MWTDKETQEALQLLKSNWPKLTPDEATNLARALSKAPFFGVMRAIETCYVSQPVARKPSPREILTHVGDENAVRDSTLSPRGRLYREIESAEKVVAGEPDVYLRGLMWEATSRGLSRKINPKEPWTVTNTRAVPMGDLSDQEVQTVAGAYRARLASHLAWEATRAREAHECAPERTSAQDEASQNQDDPRNW